MNEPTRDEAHESDTERSSTPRSFSRVCSTARKLENQIYSRIVSSSLSCILWFQLLKSVLEA